MSGQAQSLITPGEFLKYSTEQNSQENTQAVVYKGLRHAAKTHAGSALLSDNNRLFKMDAWLTQEPALSLSSFESNPVVRVCPPRHINVNNNWQMCKGRAALTGFNWNYVYRLSTQSEQSIVYEWSRPHLCGHTQQHSHSRHTVTQQSIHGACWWRRWLCLEPE